MSDPHDPHRPRRRLHPLDLGEQIAAVPERDGLPSPLVCWENGRLTVTWRHPRRRRQLRVVVEAIGAAVEHVRPRGTTAYVVGRDPIGLIRTGIDWLIQGDDPENIPCP